MQPSPIEPCLVLDIANQPNLPKRFRLDKANQLIGSGQFSEQQLQCVIEQVQVPIWLVDLRQESHGFVNGHAISWYGQYNWANVDKTSQQIEQDEQQRLAELSLQPQICLGEVVKHPNALPSIAENKWQFEVQQVCNEAELANRYGLAYTRFWLTDHQAPAATQIERFMTLISQRSKDTWFYLHCRGGAGRTTTFMLLYEMLLHAKQFSFSELLSRQHHLGGSDFTKLPSINSYKYVHAVKRVETLQLFYEYCRTHDIYEA